jgi:hypothetical protein
MAAINLLDLNSGVGSNLTSRDLANQPTLNRDLASILARDPLSILVVDYLTLLARDGTDARRREDEVIRRHVYALKTLAKVLRIPVLMLVQLLLPQPFLYVHCSSLVLQSRESEQIYLLEMRCSARFHRGYFLQSNLQVQE